MNSRNNITKLIEPNGAQTDTTNKRVHSCLSILESEIVGLHNTIDKLEQELVGVMTPTNAVSPTEPGGKPELTFSPLVETLNIAIRRTSIARLRINDLIDRLEIGA